MSEHPSPEIKSNVGMGEIVVFTLKLCLFLASFGFAFPTLLSH